MMKKNFINCITIIGLLSTVVFLSSWDLWDKAKAKTESSLNNLDTGDNKNPYIRAKLDTLEKTVNLINKGKLSNQEFAAIEYHHLRLAKELSYCLAGIVMGGGGKSRGGAHIQLGGVTGNDYDSRYREATAGFGGGHLYNRNWVSGYIVYKDHFDYFYVDETYPFDESNPLPTFNP